MSELPNASKPDLTRITDQVNTRKETGWKQKLAKIIGKVDYGKIVMILPQMH